MKDVAQLDQELTIEERNLLSVAYKNIIVSLISQLGLICVVRQRSADQEGEKYQQPVGRR